MIQALVELIVFIFVEVIFHGFGRIAARITSFGRAPKEHSDDYYTITGAVVLIVLILVGVYVYSVWGSANL